MMITGANIRDTTMMTAALEDICIPHAGTARPRTRPELLLETKSYPSTATRTCLRARGIATTIPTRDDPIALRRKKPGHPIDHGHQQQERYKPRNVVERRVNRLKHRRGSAMHQDKLAPNCRADINLSAMPIWIRSTSITPR